MSWRDEWAALSRRIRSLVEAGSVYGRLAFKSDDPFGGAKELRRQASEISDQLREFNDEFAHLLPEQAGDALRRWVDAHGERLFNHSPNSSKTNDQNVIRAGLPILAAIESELTYYLADSQLLIRRRSERAFIHLQRSIAADPEVRSRWRDAFGEGEVRCEKLGSAHLLSHGIWAFKVEALGARTDLVFQEPLADHLEDVERAAEGLVLTEWKVAKEPDEVGRNFEEARQQAERYAGGALAGIELTEYRYAVVVTEHQQDPPDDLPEDGVTYRHINIAVNPRTPSKA